MSIIKFTQQVLVNKKGVLKPDDNGYYTVVLGGLNCYNSANEYYVAEEATKLFESSSTLMRRIKAGALHAELGHPKRVPGMSIEDFYRRILTIYENNVCAHISEVWLDTDFGKRNPHYGNPDLIAIMGKVCPAGAKADALRVALENEKQNPAFSVRGLTDNHRRNGRVERVLTEIITWDYVIEPGISIATKWTSPVLETLSDDVVLKERLKSVVKETLESPVATESTKQIAADIYKRYIGKKPSRIFDW